MGEAGFEAVDDSLVGLACAEVVGLKFEGDEAGVFDFGEVGQEFVEVESAVFGSDVFAAVVVAQVDVADLSFPIWIDLNRLQSPGSEVGGVHCQVGETADFFDCIPVPQVPTTAETVEGRHVFNA